MYTLNYLLLYSLITFLMVFLITNFSYKLDLLDSPNERKKHQKPTAYTGGLAISLAYVFSIFLFDIKTEKLNLILSIAFLIAIVGFVDDRFSLNVGGN